MYKVTKEDLVGEIKDFPIEVVQKMVERQVEQNGKPDVSVFQECIFSGFLWSNTIENNDFWEKVISDNNFYLFFEKYPKEEITDNEEVDTHVYYRGNAERGDEIISELINIGGINYYSISAGNIDCYYFVDPNNKRINFVGLDTTCSHILEECYTEKFLPENKQEIIEIDGKKYNKQEVLDRMKELKEVKQ